MKKIFFTFILLGMSAVSLAQSEKKTDDEKPPVNNLPRSDDSLYLESTVVGDKEQPTVSYFIPWKGTGTPDKLNWNIEQKNDKTLDLIDRDIMVRSMSIYNELDMENTAPIE
ncbi:hypothetical protein TDB9533_04196 [Thalassocella blandensis]|nr:hypothetical protein TDB9533_04196 [Thalassocella blandensis]